MKLFFLFLTTLVAHATTFLPTPLPSQVADTSNIVRGKIGTSYADWSVGSDGSRRIYTYYQLQTTEVIKGNVDSTPSILIREMGGEKDGIGMQISGTAQFEHNEDVVVFLGPKNPDHSYDVRGLATGKYNLERQEDGSERLVGLGLSGAGPEGFVEGHSDTGHGNMTAKKWTLEGLRAIVREQGGAPEKPTKTAPSPVSSRPGISSSGLMTPSNNESPAAPQLQSSSLPSSDGERWPIAKILIWIAGIVAVGGLLIWALKE